MTHPPHTASLGGYRLVDLKTFDGHEGLGFTGTITLDGVPIIRVRNAGEGGSHSYDAVSPLRSIEEASIGFAALRDALDLFEEHASEWAQGREYAGLEDGGALVWHLLAVNGIDQQPGVVFILDDQTYFDDGEAHEFRASVTFVQALAALRGPEYVGRNPRIWDRTLGTFVAVG